MERWRKQRRLRGIVYFEEINKQTVFEPVLTMWKHVPSVLIFAKKTRKGEFYY